MLRKIFGVNIKENIPEEAEKRRRWLISKMKSLDYETKEWITDMVPFMKQYPSQQYEHNYQNELE